ncbi:MAG: ExbD/TolR family protein [Thermoguttaceae bacterium]
MRIRSELTPRGFDMTPMIDIAFLLIAFFMVLINFSEADQNERIRLPRSELAQPPEVQPREPLVLQVLGDGNVIYGGREYTPDAFAALLAQEERVYKAMDTDMRTITVILRGDAACPTEKIQRVIEMCQQSGFVDFKLRVAQGAEEEGLHGTTTDR